jgi:hypothetical protein
MQRWCSWRHLLTADPEVIIFVLLDLFRFAPSKKEIYWNDLGIVVPSTSRETLHPEMPLVVSRVL